MKNLLSLKIKKKERFGSLLSSVFRAFINFIKRVKIFINGKKFLEKFAKEKNLEILTLPTGKAY